MAVLHLRLSNLLGMPKSFLIKQSVSSKVEFSDGLGKTKGVNGMRSVLIEFQLNELSK